MPSRPSSRGAQPGDLVAVASRTRPGENRPGGIGHVVAVEENVYAVKYVLGGHVEKDIKAEFVQLHTFDEGRRRREPAGDAAQRTPIRKPVSASSSSSNRTERKRASSEAPYPRESKITTKKAVRNKPTEPVEDPHPAVVDTESTVPLDTREQELKDVAKQGLDEPRYDQFTRLLSYGMVGFLICCWLCSAS